MEKRYNTENKEELKELKEMLGKYAIIEGSSSLSNGLSIDNLRDIIQPTETILNVYTNYLEIGKLQEKGVTSLVIETTFTYKESILGIGKYIKGLIENGFKLKKIFLANDFGMREFYLMANPFGIEIYKIHSYKDYTKLEKYNHVTDPYLDKSRFDFSA